MPLCDAMPASRAFMLEQRAVGLGAQVIAQVQAIKASSHRVEHQDRGPRVGRCSRGSC